MGGSGSKGKYKTTPRSREDREDGIADGAYTKINQTEPIPSRGSRQSTRSKRGSGCFGRSKSKRGYDRRRSNDTFQSKRGDQEEVVHNKLVETDSTKVYDGTDQSKYASEGTTATVHQRPVDTSEEGPHASTTRDIVSFPADNDKQPLHEESQTMVSTTKCREREEIRPLEVTPDNRQSIALLKESPRPTPRKVKKDYSITIEEPLYQNLQEQKENQTPKYSFRSSRKADTTDKLEVDEMQSRKPVIKTEVPKDSPKDTTQSNLPSETAYHNEHQSSNQSIANLINDPRQESTNESPDVEMPSEPSSAEDDPVYENWTLQRNQTPKFPGKATRSNLQSETRDQNDLNIPNQSTERLEKNKKSHDSTRDIPDPKRLKPSQIEEESGCLKEFLGNVGLDPEKHCRLLANERITTLKELQATVNDEMKSSKLDSKLKGVNKEILEKATEHEEILDKLGLISEFPQKITLQKAMEKSSDKLTTLHDVPWYFLTKMLMIDYRGRDELLPKTEKTTNGTEHMEDSEDDIFAQLSEETSSNRNSSGVHPMDVLVLVFQCSSNHLRQIICEKMHVCKLSIPLVLPPFINSKSTFLLWSLRNITLGYKVNGEFRESSLVSCPMPIVSCLRLGKISRSKSQFLNEILNGQCHNTYFHKDCANGMLDRKLSNSILEISLSFPTTTEGKNQFNRPVILSNLRGDGTDNEVIKQEVLKMSSINLVMVDVSELENVLPYLKFISSNAQMLLMLTKHSSTKFDTNCKEAIKKCVEEIKCERFKADFLILDFNARGEKNIKDLKDEVISKLNKAFDSLPANSLENFKPSLNMKVDENLPECQENLNKSLALIEKVKNIKTENPKKDLLPLQCHLWQEWAKLTKEEHRLQNKPEDRDKNAAMRKELRQEQIRCLEKPDNFIVPFINSLMENDDNARHYFLKWLKLYLDEISRQRIPPLQNAYGSKWEERCQASYGIVPDKLYEELNELEVNIAEASFGIEHLIREMGQCYEACTSEEGYDPIHVGMNIYHLPQIAAKLLLQGYPLELMDGDAAFVPVTWVKAVLNALGNLIGAEKKVFVLSVLGAQSSGKSTFLNTMFGLQFAVAAGRCTRGVYAQLVPVNKEDKGDRQMEFDYILVVDTEGLKAPELSKAKFNHDNEIATLVTGLGDVTLINIKGENVAEMQDVLQVVVHAILKMRLVNKSLDLQPTCIFLHQNVSVPDAAQKMKSGQQKFMEIMDKVTKVTGEKENAIKYSKLKHVINFDINKHIWYFSDLWEGDPPMAPANPGYSDRVNKLKHNLLTQVMQQRKAILTVSKLSDRIEDLWNGILQENFVFSLKNSLESRAYISLEHKILELSMDLRNNASNWVNKNKLQNLEQDNEKLLKHFEQHLTREYGNNERKLVTFMELSEDSEILEQWRQTSLSQLKDVYKDILTQTKTQLQIKKSSKSILTTDL